MTVNNTLGIARCSRGVADRGSLCLVQFRPVVDGLLLRQKRLVTVAFETFQIGFAADDYDLLHSVQQGHHRPENSQQGGIQNDGLVLCVIDDVGDVLRGQADIDCVHDRPHRGDRQVGFHVRRVVPAESANPVTRYYAQRRQSPGEAGGIVCYIGIRRMDYDVAIKGTHAAVGKNLLTMLHDHLHGHRCVHHGGLHHQFPCVANRASASSAGTSYSSPRA